MMSAKKSKCILGLFAVLIMMHHLGQKVSAPWVPDTVRQHGLEIFVPIGYLLVAFFFFCSGYGLYKSAKTKEFYFTGFLVKRFNNTLLVFLIADIAYLAVRATQDVIDFPLNPYSWFVETIVILYIGFYLTYKKEGRLSFALMSLWILAYTVICYVLNKGNWWINSTPVFLLGIYFAGHEESTLKKITDKKAVLIIISAVVTLITFLISENAGFLSGLLHIKNYGIVNIFIVIVQIIASSFFSIFVYLIALCIKDKEKRGPVAIVLTFFGNMTLEFYLIHGLFVQIFGHHFLYDSVKPVAYIKFVPLYVLVVFVLATVSAFALKKLKDLAFFCYDTFPMFRKFCNEQKKIGLVILGLFVLFTVICAVSSHKSSKEAEPVLEEYAKEFIDFVEVDGTKVATYVTGEGDCTLVFLGDDSQPCPTLYYRFLADRLSDVAKVVLIDFPGKGFSDDSDAERTSDYFADIVHGVIEETGDENIVLVASELSSVYAFRYIEKYPDNVVGFFGIDPAVPELGKHLNGNFTSDTEYRWNLKRTFNYEKMVEKLMVATGFVRFEYPAYEFIFYGSGLQKWVPVMKEKYISTHMNTAHANELANSYDNCMAVMDFKMRENIHACFLMNIYVNTEKIYGIDWQKEYEKIVTNEEKQEIVFTNWGADARYYDTKIEEFVKSIEITGSGY